MANVVLLGTDPALLEGIAQALAAAGHTPIVIDDQADLLTVARAEGTTVLVTERALLLAPDVIERLPATLGTNALIVFHTDAHTDATRDHAGSAAVAQRLHRLVLADLCLPLERHRLVALVRCVEELAERAGRSQAPDGTDQALLG